MDLGLLNCKLVIGFFILGITYWLGVHFLMKEGLFSCGGGSIFRLRGAPCGTSDLMGGKGFPKIHGVEVGADILVSVIQLT